MNDILIGGILILSANVASADEVQTRWQITQELTQQIRSGGFAALDQLKLEISRSLAAQVTPILPVDSLRALRDESSEPHS